MNDDTTFERRLSIAFAAYADLAPIDVDAVTMTASAADLGGTSRRAPGGNIRGRWAIAFLVAMLGLAAMAGAAFVGSGPAPARPFGIASPVTIASPAVVANGASPEPGPVDGVGHLLLVKEPASECASVERFDLGAGDPQPVASCANRLRVSSDGRYAAQRGANGLEMIDLIGGQTTQLPGSSGAATIPIEWSPDGRWFQWASCPPPSERCFVVVGPSSGGATNALPAPVDGGYWGGVTWSADSSRMLVPTGEGWLVADGDGSNQVAVPSTNGAIVLSPDGSQLSYLQSRAENGNTVATDAYIYDIDQRTSRNVTKFPNGTDAIDVTWAPDGTDAVRRLQDRPGR